MNADFQTSWNWLAEDKSAEHGANTFMVLKPFSCELSTDEEKRLFKNVLDEAVAYIRQNPTAPVADYVCRLGQCIRMGKMTKWSYPFYLRAGFGVGDDLYKALRKSNNDAMNDAIAKFGKKAVLNGLRENFFYFLNVFSKTPKNQ